jgi:hypothetical protein
MSLADELQKLQKLHESGGLTAEEYAQAKAAVLKNSATSPPPPDNMGALKDVKKFLEYVEQLPGLEAEVSFRARGGAGELPTLFRTLPLGKVSLFPKYLVFLTSITDKPGYLTLLKEQVVGIGKGLRWVANPEEFILDLVKLFGEEVEPQKALMSPNSMFIPLETVKTVEQGRVWHQGCYIKVTTTHEVVLLCQEMDIEGIWGGIWSRLSGKWQSEFVQALKKHPDRARNE